MRRFFTTLCVVFSAITIASAQDIIVLKNSQRIDAKIISVSSTEVSYKKANYVDGPTFTLNVSEIATIIYANGDAQVFNTDPESTRSSGSPKKSGGFKFNSEPLGENHPFGISIAYANKQLKEVENGVVSKSPWVYFGDDEYKKTSASLRAGVYWAPELCYGIGIQTGLYYELSTSSYDNGNENYSYKISGSEHTLSVPLRLQYRYEIIPNLSVFLYTGPSFDISLSYSYVWEYSLWGSTEKEKYNLYEAGDVSRFNILWGVGGGVRWKRLQLMLGGDWGITNLSRDDSLKARLSKPFHISFAYLF